MVNVYSRCFYVRGILAMYPKVKKLLLLLPAIGTSVQLRVWLAVKGTPMPYLILSSSSSFFFYVRGGARVRRGYNVVGNAVLVCESTLPIIYFKGSGAYLCKV